MDALNGILLSIRYYNEANNFLIGSFRGAIEDFKALGTMLNPQKGMEYVLYGEEVENEKWGRQFKFNSYKSVEPMEEEGIYRYLVNTAKWVGPSIAQQMIERYGAQTLEKLKHDPEGVAKDIKGITLERAIEIQFLMTENKEIEESAVALEAMIGGCGIRKSLPMELAKEFGWKAVDEIRKNPYMLTKYHGIGFLSADMVALHRVKIPPDSIIRKKAGVRHILQQNESNGHTWIKDTDLHSQAYELLHCDPSEGIYEMIGKSTYIEDDMIASREMATAEHGIANMIVAMAMASYDKHSEI